MIKYLENDKWITRKSHYDMISIEEKSSHQNKIIRMGKDPIHLKKNELVWADLIIPRIAYGKHLIDCNI